MLLDVHNYHFLLLLIKPSNPQMQLLRTRDALLNKCVIPWCSKKKFHNYGRLEVKTKHNKTKQL